MKPGTYHLYTKDVVKGTANISLSLYPNQNNRTLGSKVIMIGGTGKDSYQYFKAVSYTHLDVYKRQQHYNLQVYDKK